LLFSSFIFSGKGRVIVQDQLLFIIVLYNEVYTVRKWI